jgi:LacI family transcriptional regulator
MSKRATIADVAALTGVHKATVSRALNPVTEAQVNPATARRIQKAAKQLGYVPNMMARSLRTSQSMAIGVIVPDLTNPIFPPIVRGIENHLAPRGYTALVANTDGREEVERTAFASLLQRSVDGFIIATGVTEHPLITEAHEKGVRAVLVNRGVPAAPYPLVTGDDAAGIAAAVEHLARLGHRNILHIAGPQGFSTSVVRQAAFRSAVAARPELNGEVIVASGFNVVAGRQCMDEVLSSRGHPSAIVAGNDLLALGAIRSLRAHGYHCPEDVSIVGFNDMPFAQDFEPALTTVHVPFLEMGAEAARILLESIESPGGLSFTVSLPVSLVVRASTAAPAASAGT